MGLSCAHTGDIDRGLRYLEQALSLDPARADTHSNLLMVRLYREGTEPNALPRVHARWGRRNAGPAELDPLPASHASSTATPRLRIGLLSHDLRDHPVATFLLAVLEHLDRSSLEVHCYANLDGTDHVSARLRDLSAAWCGVRALPDREVARRIRSDGIGVLVDLAGHTPGNRLPVFAWRATPVQLSWLGYPFSTGLEQMDYRLTDVIADPPGQADDEHTETLIRLPGGFLCYGGSPVAAPRWPAVHRPITFCSFNNAIKLSEETITTWSAILREAPEVRLLLKARQFRDPRFCALVNARFYGHGVEAGRLELRAWQDDEAVHLDTYGEAHVALALFPDNGTTTTFDALWMGVPVVTLCGTRHPGRVGASILEHLGEPDWVADSTHEYVAKAVSLARDRGALERLRTTLRERLRASTLMDARGFSERLQATLIALHDRALAGRARP